MRVGLVSAHGGASIGRDPGNRDGAHLDTTGRASTGTRQHIDRLAAELARLGHDVRVYQRRSTPDEPPDDERGGYRVISVPVGPPHDLGTADLLGHLPEIGSWLAGQWQRGDWSPDVVHGHFWPGGLAVASAVGRTSVPLVQTFHSVGSQQQRVLGPDYRGPRVRVALEQALSRVVDAAIAQCTDEVDELARMGRDRASVAMIPPGVDIDRFCPDTEERPRRRRRILSVGGLTAGYGHDDLIRCLRLVGDADLIVAGGPAPTALGGHPDAHRLRALADRCGVTDQVELLGVVAAQEMPELYRSVDLVVCASRYAPAGTVALEAMACGVPVVGYAHGGVGDCVVDSVTGRLVPVGDVRSLGLTVRRLLADDAERFAYGHAAIDRVRCRYSWERTATAVERLYHRVLGLRGRCVPVGSVSGAEPPDGDSVELVDVEINLAEVETTEIVDAAASGDPAATRARAA
ncbi:glycosyltransferase [Solwaraspora sp. WMMD406]|uniref:glycosyltransferase n=1 Tax=Solwaraspora sp. WMMD406 TaxID=3016095 RepID=UPI0024167A7E|nr:glycosyltransferase [Solwaraspora sp. WMMD406]MDG4767645.1 glycosyltransferase [Solwaraspora sp. WMMD406]